MTTPEGWGLDPWGLGPYGSIVSISPLSLVSAIAISTNEVQVTLTQTPLHESVTAPGDALNPTVWSVQRLGTLDFLNVLSVRVVDPVTYVITTLQPFGPHSELHRVSSITLLSEFGEPITGSTSADFYGLLGQDLASAVIAAQNRNALTKDIANPPTPVVVPSAAGGTLQISTDGDYKVESGLPLLRKLIIRRLISQKGEFFHLPDYGVGLAVKGILGAADLIQLRAEIERQVLREPEVAEVNATLILGASNDLTIQIRAKLRATGEQLDVSLSSSAGGVVL